MIPVVTPEEMRALDAASGHPLDVLVRRAGAAVARVALEHMGGAYGRRVNVVVGKGNNGADGRVAARLLERRGVRVRLFDAPSCPGRLPPSDLVVDAAYGTGFRGHYESPDTGGSPVLAVDIPSGVDGLTGEAAAGAVRADVTVTFAALKPGLLFTERAGAVVVEDIGVPVEPARAHDLTPRDVTGTLPPVPRTAHKYRAAVLVVAGSPGMTGAASLTSRAVLRAGAGYCRLGVPGVPVESAAPSEIVAVPLEASNWAAQATGHADRMGALAVGPGLGRSDATVQQVRSLLLATALPAVVDADGLFALGDAERAGDVVRRRNAPTVLTPHEGEFERLANRPVGADRLASVRALATETGATVLLKGPVTVVASPDGQVLTSRLGPPSLATAGTGDVLTGIIAAFLAMGLPPLQAAGIGAAAHGTAALAGPRRGLVAGDLLDRLPQHLSGQ